MGLDWGWDPAYLMAVVGLVAIIVVYYLFLRKAPEEEAGKSHGNPPRN